MRTDEDWTREQNRERKRREREAKMQLPLIQKRKDDKWMELAACRDHAHPEWWWPDGRGKYDGKIDTPETTAAKLLCSGCSVREECFVYAQSKPVETEGIWGGLTPSQRGQRRRKRYKV